MYDLGVIGAAIVILAVPFLLLYLFERV